MICIHHISYINHIRRPRRPRRAPHAHALRASRRASKVDPKRAARPFFNILASKIRYLINSVLIVDFNISPILQCHFKFLGGEGVFLGCFQKISMGSPPPYEGVRSVKMYVQTF